MADGLIRWHLIAPSGAISRTAYAPDRDAALRALYPIPEGEDWWVASAASFALGYTVPKVVPRCAKCYRHAPVAGQTKCEGCRGRDRGTERKARMTRHERWWASLSDERKAAIHEARNAKRRKRACAGT